MKKLEFSKVLTLIAVIMLMFVGVWSIIRYYSLMELAIINSSCACPDSAIPIACITTILGALLSYCLYQFGLKNSRNKYGVDSDGNPFKQSIIFNDLKDEEEDLENIVCGEIYFPEQTPVDCDYNGD